MIDSDRLIREFIELLEINSPSRKESPVAEYVSAKLGEIGFKVAFDEAHKAIDGEVGNLIATLPGTDAAEPKVLLCAHMDTVRPTDGIRVIRENGLIRQEGAAVLGADDKGGIMAIVEGVRSVVQSGQRHGQIQVLLLIAEEIGLLGSKHLEMSQIDSEMGYVFDSGQPVGHLVSSAPFHDNIRAKITGRAAHSGVCPEEGISAVQAAATAISRMKLGRIDFETTSNVGVVQGGTARNVVPEVCEIQAEARSRDEGKLDEQVRHMKQALEDAAAQVSARVETIVTRQYLGYKHAPNAPLVEYALRAANSIGLEPELLGHGGGSDCNILNEKGLPTAVIGVGYEKIHTAEEFISEENLVRCTQFAAALAAASGA